MHCSKVSVLVLLFWLSVCGLHAQQTYEEFLRQQQQGVKQQEDEFAQYDAQVTAEYQKFYEDQQRAFQEYVRQIERQWGEKNALTGNRKQWVAYDNDYGARRRVDFESGQTTVEVLADANETNASKDIQSKLQAAVAKTATDRGSGDPLDSKEHVQSSASALLAGQLKTKSGRIVTSANADVFAREVLSSSGIHQETVIGTDGKKRVSFSVRFPLVPNHVRVRAGEFRDLVQQVARKLRVRADLVFSVIHTESWFNPKARSWAPAYGLMQLVPTSGARAAYQHLFGNDKLVTPGYLYVPQNNIQLGTGYLDVLLRKEFSGIHDELSRIYCAIAAYNTGPGNVARAFVGKRNIKEAVSTINNLSPQQVFARLQANLPYQETRDYIVKVTERIPFYREWNKE